MATTENDDLTCPITLELLRDPVLASDGHVYEREAITRWILQHGTSPLTRESLNINDLRADDHLRRLAARRRNATVSFDARNDTVILPPVGGMRRNTATVAPMPATNVVPENDESEKDFRRTVCLGLAVVMGFATIVVAIILFGGQSSETTPTVSYRLKIISNYASALTMNSPVFTRPGFPYNLVYYKVIQVQVLVTGPYEFKSVSNVNICGYLYEGYFNATNSSMNLLPQYGSSSCRQGFSWNITLAANNYTLVATTDGANRLGSFSVVVSGFAKFLLY